MARFHELFSGHSCLVKGSEDYDLFAFSTKFDLGEIDDVFENFYISNKEFLDIPAPISLFQFTNSLDLHFVLAVDKGDYVQWCHIWKGVNSGFVLNDNDVWVDIYKETHASFVHRRDGSEIDTHFLVEETVEFLKGCGKPGPDSWSFAAIIAVACSVEVFSCSNVHLVEHQVSKFTNEKRIKKGKVPFFSFKTIHIKQDFYEASQKESVKSNISARESPRLHLRRGHIRRLASGNKVWVRSSMVGVKSNGMVINSYKVIK